MTLAYLAFYLGLTRLAVLVLRAKRVHVGLLVSLLLMVVLSGAGALVPFFGHVWLTRGFSDAYYSVLQTSNWVWTIGEWVDGSVLLGGDLIVATIAVAAGGLLAFCANLALAYREVERTRVATPTRVVEDEQLLHPRKEVTSTDVGDPWGDDGEGLGG